MQIAEPGHRTEAARRRPRGRGSSALLAAGYTRTDMGGGVMAWRLSFSAGELLIDQLADRADGWSVRLYGDQHSEPLNSLTGVSLADAIEAGEVFRLQAAGCNA